MTLELGEPPKENLQIVASAGEREGQRILQLKGALTIHTVFGFQEAVRKEATPELILDLSGVPYVDSAGVGALLAAYVRTEKAKGKLAFTGMNNQLKTLAEMTRVMQFFRLYPSVKDAQTAFLQEQ
jgi:anti-sigma B factor antagonist